MKAEDRRFYYSAGSAISLPFTRMLSEEYLRYILPIKSKNKKCLILDLDNTLWGGVAAEEGLSGIKLDPSGPGRAYYDFQKEILNLYKKGILLAVNSKNNADDVSDILDNHPYMLLRKKHFSAVKINWQDKASNMREICEDLNIGLDSLVFFDDSPLERDYVKSELPCIKVVNVPEDASRYADVLKNLVDFETLIITAEDLKRNNLYESGKKRSEYMTGFKNMDAYLAGLDINLTIGYAQEFTIPRITQLIMKTNQFNMTTRRYNLQEIKSMVSSDKYAVISCSAADRFGDYGIIGACIVYVDSGEALIDTFLLSCRALGRNIEKAFLYAVVRILREKGFKKIRSIYIKTSKNLQNIDFYPRAGFIRTHSVNDESFYILPDGTEIKKPDYIAVRLPEDNDG